MGWEIRLPPSYHSLLWALSKKTQTFWGRSSLSILLPKEIFWGGRPMRRVWWIDDVCIGTLQNLIRISSDERLGLPTWLKTFSTNGQQWLDGDTLLALIPILKSFKATLLNMELPQEHCKSWIFLRLTMRHAQQSLAASHQGRLNSVQAERMARTLVKVTLVGAFSSRENSTSLGFSLVSWALAAKSVALGCLASTQGWRILFPGSKKIFCLKNHKD